MTICGDCGSEYVYSPFLQCNMCPNCTPKKLAPVFQSDSFQNILKDKFSQSRTDNKKARIEKFRVQYGIINFERWIDRVINICADCMKTNPSPCKKHQRLGELIDFKSLPGA